jgi:hypothetical protein
MLETPSIQPQIPSKMTTSYPTYQDFLADWDENDKKAAEYIKESKDHVIKSFYDELNHTKTELPPYVTACAIHSTCSKLYPKYTPNIVAMCKEVEEFIQSKGFPYRLNQAESGFAHSGIWPIRCKFNLK